LYPSLQERLAQPGGWSSRPARPLSGTFRNRPSSVWSTIDGHSVVLISFGLPANLWPRVPCRFYCSQGNHCQQGMVFAINPGSQAKMDEFLANAQGGAAPATTTPGGTTTPPVVAAPTTPPPAGTTTTSDPASLPSPSASVPVTGTGREIVIDVGVNVAGQTALVFTPETATAVVGDKIIFQFKAGAHTATQSTFASPCSPLSGGANSGPMPAAGLTSGFPNYTYPVTDVSKPIWVSTLNCVNPEKAFMVADARHSSTAPPATTATREWSSLSTLPQQATRTKHSRQPHKASPRHKPATARPLSSAAQRPACSSLRRSQLSCCNRPDLVDGGLLFQCRVGSPWTLYRAWELVASFHYFTTSSRGLDGHVLI